MSNIKELQRLRYQKETKKENERQRIVVGYTFGITDLHLTTRAYQRFRRR